MIRCTHIQKVTFIIQEISDKKCGKVEEKKC